MGATFVAALIVTNELRLETQEKLRTLSKAEALEIEIRRTREALATARGVLQEAINSNDKKRQARAAKLLVLLQNALSVSEQTLSKARDEDEAKEFSEFASEHIGKLAQLSQGLVRDIGRVQTQKRHTRTTPHLGDAINHMDDTRDMLDDMSGGDEEDSLMDAPIPDRDVDEETDDTDFSSAFQTEDDFDIAQTLGLSASSDPIEVRAKLFKLAGLETPTRPTPAPESVSQTLPVVPSRPLMRQDPDTKTHENQDQDDEKQEIVTA